MLPQPFLPPRALALGALCLWLLPAASGQALTRTDEKDLAPAAPKPEPPLWLAGWSLHAQNTDIVQGAASFDSPYRGQNSLTPNQTRETVTATLFLARQLWPGAIAVVNPEYAQGQGLNGTHGPAGFPNGEATKAGSLRGKLDIERLYLTQTIGFGGAQEDIPDGRNQPATRKDVSRLSLTVGKLAASDLFDDNTYAHDPRAQFLNWSLWESGAWDYPADSKGYTYGLFAELNQKSWALRYGAFELPRAANGLSIQNDITRSLAHALELEERYTLQGGHAGKLRLLLYANRANMGILRDALDLQRAHPGLDATTALIQTRSERFKFGGAVNFEQSITDDLGAFLRLSLNDGRTESWAFTDIDRSAALGLSLKGTRWGRPDDNVGLAGVINGLSVDHRDYFAAGGLGILVGDGRLNYSPEGIMELYYLAQLTPKNFKCGTANVMLDYQFINHPGYNADRGPASVLSARLHLEY